MYRPQSPRRAPRRSWALRVATGYALTHSVAEGLGVAVLLLAAVEALRPLRPGNGGALSRSFDVPRPHLAPPHAGTVDGDVPTARRVTSQHARALWGLSHGVTTIAARSGVTSAGPGTRARTGVCISVRWRKAKRDRPWCA
jgi:hypothetical protein